MAKAKIARTYWFKKVRGSYLPCSFAGWATYLPFTAYLVVVPIAAYHATGSLLLTGLLTIPNWVAATAAMTYIAAKTSR